MRKAVSCVTTSLARVSTRTSVSRRALPMLSARASSSSLRSFSTETPVDPAVEEAMSTQRKPDADAAGANPDSVSADGSESHLKGGMKLKDGNPSEHPGWCKEVDGIAQMIAGLRANQMTELNAAIIHHLGLPKEHLQTLYDKLHAPSAVMGGGDMGGAGGGGAAPAAKEQTEFNVRLESFGAEKIKVIKEVRTVTQLGLKEAKALVESAPCSLAEALSKEEAEKVKEALEKVGAKCSIE